jgi:GxxExxY protein
MENCSFPSATSKPSGEATFDNPSLCYQDPGRVTGHPEVGRAGRSGATTILPGETEAGSLVIELGLRGIRATARASFEITYKDHSVGEYYADILVEDVLVVELKCVERLGAEHTAQCINYLRASGRTLCLLGTRAKRSAARSVPGPLGGAPRPLRFLVNFQKPKVEWKRIAYGFQTPEPLATSSA